MRKMVCMLAVVVAISAIPQTALVQTQTTAKTAITDKKTKKKKATPLTRMQSDKADVDKDLEKARSERRLPVIRCLEEKLQLMRNWLAVSKRANKRLKEEKTKKTAKLKQRYQDRLDLAESRVRRLRDISNRCWLADRRGPDADGVETTLVALQIVDSNDGLTLFESFETDSEGNLGFPPVPPASAFR